MAVGEPWFVMPSHKYFMQTEIPKLYVDIKQKAQSVASSAPKAVNQLNFLYMPCVGHHTELGGKEGFELSQVSKTSVRIHKLACYFHRSTKPMSKLCEKQQLLGMDMTKTWNGTINGMMQRMGKLHGKADMPLRMALLFT